ncbi:cardioacceleratory peptide receptor [Octopus bimaculoides]|nr:cardioacceleratory peptide receptor [Octopus bimaculoides]
MDSEEVPEINLTLNITAQYLEEYSSNCTQNLRNVHYFYRTGQLVFLFLLLCFITSGNLILLGAVTLSRAEKRSRMNFFIMHLAIADLLNGFLGVLPELVWKFTVVWYGGPVLCKIIPFIRAVITLLSTFILVSLSIDRLHAIARPMRFSQSSRLSKLLVTSAWVFAVILPTPLMIFTEQIDICIDNYQCWMNLPKYMWKIYFTIVSFVALFIPALLILFCYVTIIYIIWQNGKNEWKLRAVGNHSWRNGGDGKREESITSNSGHRFEYDTHYSRKTHIPQARIRTIKMTFLIVLVFILCWSPYMIYDLLQVYDLLEENVAVATFVQSLAPLNSAANPIIYGIFTTRICKSLRKMKRIKNGVGMGRMKYCMSRRQTQRTSTFYTDISSVREAMQKLSCGSNTSFPKVTCSNSKMDVSQNAAANEFQPISRTVSRNI